MRVPVYQVDAFANERFRGNPAAVCLLQEPVGDEWMQAFAMEMNLSETAFLHPEASDWRLRWFTPKVEVSLCGHATLASAHILWETGALALEKPAVFQTLSGALTCVRRGAWIEMDFPAVFAKPAAPPDLLLSALRVEPVFVGVNKMDYLVQVKTEAEVRELKPNITQLSELPVRGVIVTARSDTDQYDFVSRFFAPAAGVPEDPVTGSAHCCLAPFWSKQLGKTGLTGYQTSQRGGFVRMTMAGERVMLSGQAVTVLRGELV